jgi:2'-5' RNA ligase
MALRSKEEMPAAQAAALARCFIALDIGAEARATLETAIRRLTRIGARVGWVAPENIHLTLLFLGDTPDILLPEIGRRLDAIAAGCAPFVLRVAGLGYFGPPRAPRVIWADVPERSPPLSDLQRAVADSLSACGCRREAREFVPHLTLGRVRSAVRAAELTAAIAGFREQEFGRIVADRLLLIQSQLESQGARYVVRHTAAFGSAGHESASTGSPADR